MLSTQRASVTPIGRGGLHAAEADGTGAHGPDAVEQPLHPPIRKVPATASKPIMAVAPRRERIAALSRCRRTLSRPGSPDCRTNLSPRPRRLTCRRRDTINNMGITRQRFGSCLPRPKQSSAGRDSAGMRGSSGRSAATVSTGNRADVAQCRSALVSTTRARTLHRRCSRPTWRGLAHTSSQRRRGFHRRSTSIWPSAAPGATRCPCSPGPLTGWWSIVPALSAPGRPARRGPPARAPSPSAPERLAASSRRRARWCS